MLITSVLKIIHIERIDNMEITEEKTDFSAEFFFCKFFQDNISFWEVFFDKIYTQALAIKC